MPPKNMSPAFKKRAAAAALRKRKAEETKRNSPPKKYGRGDGEDDGGYFDPPEKTSIDTMMETLIGPTKNDEKNKDSDDSSTITNMIARVRQKAAAEAAAAEEDVPEDAKQKADTEMGRDKAAAKPIADPEMNPAKENDNPGPKDLFVEDEHVKDDRPSVGTPAAKPIADPEMNPANQNDNPGPKVLFVEEEHVKEDSPSVGTPVVCVRVEKGFKYYTMDGLIESVKKTIGFDIESVKMPGPILPEEMPYKDFLLMINMFDMCYPGFWSTALLKIQHVASDTNLDETGKSKDSSDEDEEPAGSKDKCLDLRHGYVQKGVTVPWQLVLDLERLWMPNANLVQGVEEFDRKNSTVYDEGTDMSAYPPENPFPITEIVYVKQTGHESENMSCVDQTTGGAYVSKVKTEISPLLSLMFVSGGSYRDKENETQPRYKPFLPCYHAQAKVNQRDIQPYRVRLITQSVTKAVKNQVFNQSYCYAPCHISPAIHDTVGFLSSVHLPLGDGELKEKTMASRLTDEGGVEVIFKLFFDRTFAEIFTVGELKGLTPEEVHYIKLGALLRLLQTRFNRFLKVENWVDFYNVMGRRPEYKIVAALMPVKASDPPGLVYYRCKCLFRGFHHLRWNGVEGLHRENSMDLGLLNLELPRDLASWRKPSDYDPEWAQSEVQFSKLNQAAPCELVFISGRKYAFDAVGLNIFVNYSIMLQESKEGNVGRSLSDAVTNVLQKMENGDGKFVDVFLPGTQKLASFNVEAASSIKGVMHKVHPSRTPAELKDNVYFGEDKARGLEVRAHSWYRRVIGEALLQDNCTDIKEIINTLNTTTNYCKGAGVPKEAEPKTPSKKKKLVYCPTPAPKETSEMEPMDYAINMDHRWLFSAVFFGPIPWVISKSKRISPMPAAALIAFITNYVFDGDTLQTLRAIVHLNGQPKSFYDPCQHQSINTYPLLFGSPGRDSVKQDWKHQIVHGFLVPTTILFNAFWKKYLTYAKVKDPDSSVFRGGVNKISTQQRLMYSIGKTWLWIVRDYGLWAGTTENLTLNHPALAKALSAPDSKTYPETYIDKDNNKRGTNLSILAGYLACMIENEAIELMGWLPAAVRSGAAPISTQCSYDKFAPRFKMKDFPKGGQSERQVPTPKNQTKSLKKKRKSEEKLELTEGDSHNFYSLCNLLFGRDTRLSQGGMRQPSGLETTGHTTLQERKWIADIFNDEIDLEDIERACKLLPPSGEKVERPKEFVELLLDSSLVKTYFKTGSGKKEAKKETEKGAGKVIVPKPTSEDARRRLSQMQDGAIKFATWCSFQKGLIEVQQNFPTRYGEDNYSFEECFDRYSAELKKKSAESSKKPRGYLRGNTIAESLVTGLDIDSLCLAKDMLKDSDAIAERALLQVKGTLSTKPAIASWGGMNPTKKITKAEEERWNLPDAEKTENEKERQKILSDANSGPEAENQAEEEGEESVTSSSSND